MNENENARKPRRYRTGLFWPVVLIFLGVFWLLSNMRLMTGDVWDTLVPYWPLFLVLIGLDLFLRREGVVGAALWIGLGVAFLLSNFGLLNLNILGILVRTWPLFLVAIGLDILVSHRSKLFSLAGAVIILAVLAGILSLASINIQRAGALAGESFNLPFENEKQARIRIEPGAGSLRLKKLAEPVALIMGQIPLQLTPEQVASPEQDMPTFQLRGESQRYLFPKASNTYDWDLGLTTQIPLTLQISLGAGEALLDLSGLQLSLLEMNLGVGSATIILPATVSFNGKIEGAVGRLVIVVPPEVGVRIVANTGLAFVQAGKGITKESHRVYTTVNYASAENHIDLEVTQAIGSIVIRQP